MTTTTVNCRTTVTVMSSWIVWNQTETSLRVKVILDMVSERIKLHQTIPVPFYTVKYAWIFLLILFVSIGSVSEFRNWNNVSDHDRVKRQLSVSSDSKLLDEDIREEARVILRPKKPPRPKSEVLLNQGSDHRRTKRYSAFGVSHIIHFLKIF